MRKKVRNLFLFFTVLAVLLPGCGGQADAGDTGADEEKNDTQTVQEDTDEYSCGFIVGSFEQVFYQKLGDAIESEAAQIGMHAIVTDSELDSQVASNKIQSLADQGCQAIALSCNDPEGVREAIDQAASQGVAMFTFDCTADSDSIQCFVGTDNYKGGQLGGQEILKYSQDGDTVGIIGDSTDAAGADKEQGALHVLDGQNRTVISGNDFEGDPNKAQEIMGNLLVEHPEISVVFCVDDTAATGALAAIKEAGSECKLIGYDGNPEALEAIADTEGNGHWWVSEIAQDPQAIGETLVEQMQIYLEEGALSSKEIPIDPHVVDIDNVEEEM